jgi:hypothetical protein
MNMQNNYKGIQWGEKCLVWDDDAEKKITKIFVGYDTNQKHGVIVSTGDVFRNAEPLPKKEYVPMSPTTCPQFWWAIRKPHWKKGDHMSVLTVCTDGITVDNNAALSWQELMDEGFTDHHGNLLRVEK